MAHSAKPLGGGLEELRKLLKEGVELIFVWGGDGTVQRVIDAAAGAPVTLAILPAGTAKHDSVRRGELRTRTSSSRSRTRRL